MAALLNPANTRNTGSERSFVTFVLEPLYKLTSAVISEHPRTVEKILAEMGVTLKSSQYNQVCVYVCV